MNKAEKKLMNAKRRKGLSYYPFGVEFALPNMETGEVTKLTFKGSFDRRKLRRMLRKSLVSNPTTVEIDFMIDNFSTRLRPLNKDEMELWLASMQAEADDGTEEG